MTGKNPEQVSDKTGRILLERAAILDQSGLTLDQLRQAAAEAGISADAFEKAVEEWRHVKSFDASISQRSWPTRLLGNVAAIVVGSAAFATLISIERLLGAPGLLEKLSEPVGLCIGASFALRIRARTALVVLSGLTLSQGAEFVMDVVGGTPAIHGVGAHLALMIAGVAGVSVGMTIGRRSGESASVHASDGDIADASIAANVSDGSTSRSVGLTSAEAIKAAMEVGARSAHSY
ncbi:MAG TPA: hypothetical protein VNS10_09230 [Gemmatimonadaceae bacterium]|jgi:hypothetical protein|nr:hypothetical protein [Gemmatimonadaceae bacterium]